MAKRGRGWRNAGGRERMSSLESLSQLLQQSHHARPEDLPEMVMEAAPLVGAAALVIYVVDYQQRKLTPLLGGSAPSRDAFGVDGTLAGRAFSMVTPCASEAEDRKSTRLN